MSSEDSEVTKDIASISKTIKELVERLGVDETKKEKKSSLAHRWDLIFRATAAILGVAAPALVTYSQSSSASGTTKLAAILLSAIAGASATLLGIFALQQSYVRNAVDALELNEVKDKLESDRDQALLIAKEHEKYSALKQAHIDAKRSHKNIMTGKQKTYLTQLSE